MLVQVKEKKNTIKSIMDEEGRMVESEAKLEGAFWNYFRKIYTTLNSPNDDIVNYVQHTSPK